MLSPIGSTYKLDLKPILFSPITLEQTSIIVHVDYYQYNDLLTIFPFPLSSLFLQAKKLSLGGEGVSTNHNFKILQWFSIR